MRGEKLLFLLAVLSVQGCHSLGLSSDRPRTAPITYAAETKPECGLLAPLVVNTDGSLPRADLENGLKVEFQKWDKDNDGRLSKSEVDPLNAYLQSLNVNASPIMDWNGDGHVSFEEFASGYRTMFTLCAHGGGDVVSKSELARSPSTVAAAPDKPNEHKRPEGASSGDGSY